MSGPHAQRNKRKITPKGEWKRIVAKVSQMALRASNGETSSNAGREELGDFSTTLRVLPISGLAIVIGALCAFVALVLLRLIGLFTNLFYFGRWSTALVSPAGNHLGVYSVFVPIGGALIIGVMARYGSRRLRGPGNTRAVETN